MKYPLLAGALIAAVIAMPVFAQDTSPQAKSPQNWPMFMGDARHSGLAATAPTDIASLKPVWRHRIPAEVSASPVVVGNLLYIAAENGNLYAFDLTTHKQVWLYHAEGGIGSTPAVGDGRLYALSRDGCLTVLDAATGKALWRFKTGGEARFGVPGGYGMPKTEGITPDPWDFWLSSPLVENGRVYFGSSDHHVYALDAATGAKIWAFEADDSIHAAPALNHGRLFIGTWGTRFYALDAQTGVKLWDFQGGKDAETGILQGFSAAATIDGDTVYIGSRDGYMRAFDVTNGKLRWAWDAEKSWVLATAAVDADTLYFPTSDTTVFVALDKKTGKEKYRTDTKIWTYTSPVIAGDYAFAGTMTGDMYAFDKNTGKILWHYRTEDAKADTLGLIDAAGKLRSEILFPQGFPPAPGVENVKSLGAFEASPVWSGNRLITVTAAGEIIIFSAENG
jgi:outer membrane protein assembly factor BamB